MDNVALLNSSGGIVAYYADGRYTPSLPFTPYVETVTLPVVSVDSSALYGAHPENLATLTYSSGAALTFFCDSVAGGSDTGGDGSFDNPWRSLNTASDFLSCASCSLLAAAKFVQLKVKGTVDYISGGSWQPFSALISGVAADERFILTGWGGSRIRLSGAAIWAGHLKNLELASAAANGRYTWENCAVVSGGNTSTGLAVDCEITGSARAAVAYNCSGARVNTPVVYGGSFGGTSGVIVSANYVYSAVVSGAYSGYPAADSAIVAVIRSAGVSVTVRGSAIGSAATSDGFITPSIAGIMGNGSPYLGDCDVGVLASAVVSGGSFDAGASAKFTSYTTPIVSGGTWTAAAIASAVTPSSATAIASAWGFDSNAVVHGATVTLAATASAQITGGNGVEHDVEFIHSGGTTCSTGRTRYYSGYVETSSYTPPTSCWGW